MVLEQLVWIGLDWITERNGRCYFACGWGRCNFACDQWFGIEQLEDAVDRDLDLGLM